MSLPFLHPYIGLASGLNTLQAVNFSPDDISDLYAWYDASDITTITKSLDRVSSWTNKEGTSARNLNQATGGSQPLWLSASQNGLDTIDFVSSRFILTDTNLTAITAPITMFIVCKIPSSSATVHHSMSERIDTGGHFHTFYKETNDSIRFSNTTGGRLIISSPPSLESWNYVTVVGNDTAGFIRTNGVLEVTNPAAPTGTSGTYSGICVGRYNMQVGYYWQEEIGEIIIYDKLLNATEINEVENYLATKWGL